MLFRRVVVVEEPSSNSLGAVAQLAERLHGMQEVTGSNPVSSTEASPAEPSRSVPAAVESRPSTSGHVRF